MRRLLILLLLLLPASLLAQSKLHLEFQSSGPKVAWLSDQLGAPPDSASKFDGQSFDLDLAGSGPNSIVQVLDSTSGNLAEAKLSGLKKGWLVKDADFNLIDHVQVRVEHQGSPVEVAGVTANDGAREQTFVIDSSSKGVADFYAVKPGNFSVAVDYHSGKFNKTQKQSFPLDLTRDSATPLLIVSIAEPVATVATDQSAATQSPSMPTSVNNVPTASEAKRNSTGQWFGKIATTILGLLFAGLVVYGGFMWLQKNHAKAQGALQKFGVSLQDPNPFDATVSAPVKTAPPQPQPQIILSDGSPTPIAPPSPSLSSVAQSGSPHLTRESGEIIPLAEGTFAVGRDPGLGISLVGENSVSRNHAEIVRTGVAVVVRDLGSTNGTFVNGVRVDGEAAVHSGDTIQFGSVRVRYEV